jgi:putative transposase
VKIDFSRPCKPTDNAFVESFNGTFRAECLDAHWFATLQRAAKLGDADATEFVALCELNVAEATKR